MKIVRVRAKAHVAPGRLNYLCEPNDKVADIEPGVFINGSRRDTLGPAIKLQRLSEQSRQTCPESSARKVIHAICVSHRHLSALGLTTHGKIGNLSFYTTEEQIYELFSKCTSPEEGGGVKRIIMGLDRNTKQVACLIWRSLTDHLPQNTLWVLLRGVL